MQLFRQYQSLSGELSMDIDEYIIAVRAADSMAKAWRSDVAILSNLKVVRLSEAKGTILEVVRWDL
tara:strand:+ start:642 stop:839 length:198 start_codon:yes stop_codon:yes gene_type:complete